MGKDFWKSKTLGFNVLALIIIVANAFGFLEFEQDAKLAEYGAAVVTVLKFLFPLINVGLRVVTKEPLKRPFRASTNW